MKSQPQSFCIYCQREFNTPRKLARHILNRHRLTYAEKNIKNITGLDTEDLVRYDSSKPTEGE